MWDGEGKGLVIEMLLHYKKCYRPLEVEDLSIGVNPAITLGVRSVNLLVGGSLILKVKESVR